uniref:Glycine zipper 2TM domain-containing protein n=1 Tax=Solibacter usitatus (strain Ellin6076) TaxID=234267 RepID=Q01R30_SOLUE
MMRHLPIIAFLFSLALHAQDAQWANLKSLRKGDRVGVIRTNQKRVEGRFDSVTDSRITLQADSEVSIEKSDVVRVYEPPRHGRLFGTVLGAAIGVAAGGVMDGTLGQRFRNEGDSPAKGLLTAAGAGFGAGIGAAVTGHYRTLYRR